MMAKLKLKIQGMSCKNCTKTVTDSLTELKGVQKVMVSLRKNEASVSYNTNQITTKDISNVIVEAGFEVVEKIEKRVLSFLAAYSLLLIGVIGCSDVPYTGPILSVDNVDRYVDSTGNDTVCLQDGFDSVCVKVAQQDIIDTTTIPIIDVHPENITYLFYYDGSPILQAERQMDTSELVQQLIDSGMVDIPPGGAPVSGNTAIVADGWIIQVYYPDSFPIENRGSTLQTSGLDIRVVEGTRVPTDKAQDLEIEDFQKLDSADGSSALKFSVETDANEITIQVGELVEGYTAKFYLDVDGVASDEGTNTFQLIPLR